MKILHTSDWHLGHSLYGYDRADEQMAMMLQMRDIVASEQPDAFLICGDVFHTATPGMEIQRCFAEALLSIHAVRPGMAIVVTAGNHDSGTRLEMFRQLWDVVGVRIIGHIDAKNPESHIVEIKDKGYVIAVPYAYERLIPEGFYAMLQDAVARRNSAGLPVVMTAHTTVAGCDYKGHDNSGEKSVGGIDSIAVDCFGDGYDYLALGHIHKAQSLGQRVRYSGTPLPVSFNEAYPHSVSIVTIDRHGAEPVVCQRQIDNPHPLVTLPAHSASSLDEALAALRGFDPDSEAYIRLNVSTAGFLPPTAGTDAQAATEGKRCRFCYINCISDEVAAEQSVETGMTVSQLQATAPIDIARRYAKRKGVELDEELFNEALRELTNDK